MQAGKRDIQEIFNRSRNLVIPFFQRSYVWSEEQWERFLDDMYFVCSSKQEYFLGSIILKQQSTTSNQDDMRILIDGQQRLTTLNIFFKVLFLKIKENKEFDIVFRKRDNSLILLHNFNDIDSFERILKISELIDIDNPKNQIERCYLYFKKNIDSSKLDYDILLKLIAFVGIDLAQDENEQQIFDTINSLGVRLTTGELLKNLLFGTTEIKLYENYWKDVFEKDDETIKYWNVEIGRDRRTLIDVFLLSFLQVKSQDLSISSLDKASFYIKSNLFNSYKILLGAYFKNKKLDLLKDLRDYAIIFKNHIDPMIVEKNIDNPMDRINFILFKLDTTTIIPYILYAIKNTLGDIKKRDNLLNCLESYIMRRMIGIIHGDISRFYSELFNRKMINHHIYSAEDFRRFILNSNDVAFSIPTNEHLLNGFIHKRFRNNQVLGILYLIESRIRIDKHATQLLSVDRYSLEHIMPKNWRKNWGECINPEKRDIMLLSMGNLTIIPQKLNASLRDGDWDTKKFGNGRSKGLEYFSQGLSTLFPYLLVPEWNEDVIESRARDLYDYAKVFW